MLLSNRVGSVSGLASPVQKTDVLIVGAGPTGLVLGLWLTRLGVRVRIIDRTTAPATTSRAVAVQARTLEWYSQTGLAAEVVERSRRAMAVNVWVRGEKVARAAFDDMGRSVSPFPYPLLFAQDEHERLLIDRLAEAGVTIERQTELTDCEQTPHGVVARLAQPNRVLTCEAAFLAGCDGAHSTVREKLQIGFQGGTYAHVFHVADVDGGGPALNGEVHVALDTTDFLAVFPLKGGGRARLVGTVRQDADRVQENLSWNDVSKRVLTWMRIDVDRVNWFATYRVHHRVADRFRKDRVFLLGDAAHIHSPVGGQGMNTGIGDAINLAWKLAAVLQGRAVYSILDSYEAERIAFARRLVATTDRAFTAVTSESAMARLLRLVIAPRVIPLLFALPAARRFIFRIVSQTSVNYRASPLSAGRAGRIRGGDRLPWVEPEDDGVDNFAPLESLDWQVHIYGDVMPDVCAVCEQHRLPVHVFPWGPRARRAGLQRNAVYLVRPDGHIGLVIPPPGGGGARPGQQSEQGARLRQYVITQRGS